jgi:hypothetical protein
VQTGIAAANHICVLGAISVYNFGSSLKIGSYMETKLREFKCRDLNNQKSF